MKVRNINKDNIYTRENISMEMLEFNMSITREDSPLEKTRKYMEVLTNVALRFRDEDSNMTLLGMCILLVIAREGHKDGMDMSELIKLVKSNKSSVSRAIAVFSDVGRREKEGLDLIYLEEDPLDRRYKKIYLSKEGKRLTKDAVKLMESI